MFLRTATVRTLFALTGLTASQASDAHGVDQQLGPDPPPHPAMAAYPRRQALQSAAEAYRIAEVTFDLLALGQQLPAKAGQLGRRLLQQILAPQAMGAWVLMPQSLPRPVAAGTDQLVARFRRLIE